MFKVWKNGESRIVYAVRDDRDGYPHFLIYEDGEWKYVSAKHFEPIVCDDM